MIEGSCSCGQVKYQVNGRLHDAMSCHCSICRKATGSPASAFAMFNPAEFEWLSDESHLKSYSTSDTMGHFFCTECGSIVAGTYQGAICWVTLGCIDSGIDFKIQKHVFMGSQAAWETCPADVEQYEEYPPGVG